MIPDGWALRCGELRCGALRCVARRSVAKRSIVWRRDATNENQCPRTFVGVGSDPLSGVAWQSGAVCRVARKNCHPNIFVGRGAGRPVVSRRVAARSVALHCGALRSAEKNCP